MARRFQFQANRSSFHKVSRVLTIYSKSVELSFPDILVLDLEHLAESFPASYNTSPSEFVWSSILMPEDSSLYFIMSLYNQWLYLFKSDFKWNMKRQSGETEESQLQP